jgi:hypothetical protein
MPTYANNSYAVKDVLTTGSTAISSIASGTVAVSSLILSNTGISPITVNAYITRSSINYYLVYQATVPVGGSLEAIQGNRVVLKASDSLSVISSTASSCDCWISALTAT